MKKSCRVQQMVARLTTVLLVGTLASLLGTHPAHASTLAITANVSNIPIINVDIGPLNITNTNVYGGSIVPASLDGTPLPFLYCVDLLHDIYIPNTYSASVTFDGKVHNQIVGGSLVTAGKVAWLLDQYATSAAASAAASDWTPTAALQAAIWEVIYESQFTLNGPASVLTQYNTYIDTFNTAVATGGGTASVANYAWLSPVSGSTLMQGLVTRVPEPGSTLLLAFALASLFGVGWWRRMQ
jgi:hypothetical protein